MERPRFCAALTRKSCAIAVAAVILVFAPCSLGQTYTNLFAFGSSAGIHPLAGLVFDAAGNLYGTTYHGGNMTACSGYGCGTVYKLSPNPDGTWSETVLYAFAGGSDGVSPFDTLLIDDAGNLYGTTAYGGDFNCNPAGCGTVFKLDTNGAFSTLHTFTGSDGLLPFAGLVRDRMGNLHGTTFQGGTGFGTVFKMSPNSDGTWTHNVLFNFALSNVGAYPTRGNLVVDAAGSLYGMTEGGGAYGYGTIYKLGQTPSGLWKERVLHHFKSLPSTNPEGGLMLDAKGNLYGTTRSGGRSGGGTVFMLAPKSGGVWTLSVLYAFQGNGDGSFPNTGVVQDAHGNLFGTTYAGGTGVGTVYKLAPALKGQWKETLLHVFGSGLGCQPDAPLILDALGNLYGTASYCSDGTVFEITW